MASTHDTKFCPKCQFEDRSGLRVCPNDQTELRPRALDLIGTVIDEKYEIISMIGSGGMSVVYKARHNMMDRVVAVKMLKPELGAIPQLLQRFRVESKAVAGLRHPNIVAVFDSGLGPNNIPYMVMDYLEGKTLSEILKREGRLDIDRAVVLFAQACDALAHAHERGIVHRDIKPSNLLVREENDGREAMTIFDFGIAKILGHDSSSLSKLTTSGEVFGSPLYMSPEQCNGEKIGPHTDMYSLACCLYEALVGQPPLQGTSPMDTLIKHINEDPPVLSRVAASKGIAVPTILEVSVMKALLKEPEQRHPHMTHFRNEILSAANMDVASALPHRSYDRLPAGSKSVELETGNRTDEQYRDANRSVSRQLTDLDVEVGNGRGIDRKTGEGRSKTQDAKRKAEEVQKTRQTLTKVVVGLSLLTTIGVGVFVAMTSRQASQRIQFVQGTPEAVADDEKQKDPEEVASGEPSGPVTISQLTGTDLMQAMDLYRIPGATLRSSNDITIKNGKEIRSDTHFIFSRDIPPKLLDEPNGNVDRSRCEMNAANLEPSTLTPKDAAEAVVKQIFPDSTDISWREIQVEHPQTTAEIFVQEISFGGGAEKAEHRGSGGSAGGGKVAMAVAGAATADGGGDGGSGSGGGDSPSKLMGDGALTLASGAGNSAAADSSGSGVDGADGGSSAAEGTEKAPGRVQIAQNSPSGDAAKNGGDSEGSEPAADAGSGGAELSSSRVKEYIVYLKMNERLIGCQFVPKQATEAEILEIIKSCIPKLENIVNH